MGRIPQPPAAAYIEGTGANQGNSHNKIPFFPVYMLSFVCLSSRLLVTFKTYHLCSLLEKVVHFHAFHEKFFFATYYYRTFQVGCN